MDSIAMWPTIATCWGSSAAKRGRSRPNSSISFCAFTAPTHGTYHSSHFVSPCGSAGSVYTTSEPSNWRPYFACVVHFPRSVTGSPAFTNPLIVNEWSLPLHRMTPDDHDGFAKKIRWIVPWISSAPARFFFSSVMVFIRVSRILGRCPSRCSPVWSRFDCSEDNGR